MAAKDVAVKKYVVKLNEAERSHLQALINKGKSPAKRLLKARILLKADASEAGEAWSDGQIVKALDTNMSMVTRVRQQLVEEGLEAVLSRKQRARPAITPIPASARTSLRRRERGPADGAGLLHAPRRPRALDAAAPGGQSRGTGHCRARQR